MTSISFLKTPNLPPRPEGITEVQNFGEISIMTSGLGVVAGEHVVWEGEEQELAKWVDSLVSARSGIWVGHGAASFQQFSYYDYSED